MADIMVECMVGYGQGVADSTNHCKKNKTSLYINCSIRNIAIQGLQAPNYVT